MCMHRLTALAMLGVVALLAVNAGAADGPKLGREATEAEVAGWDISVLPDGRGLPAGSGTVAAGATVYAAKCQSCHGEKGAGKPNDQLAGGQGTLASPTPFPGTLQAAVFFPRLKTKKTLLTSSGSMPIPVSRT